MTDALDFCSVLYGLLSEGVDLDDAVDEALNRVGEPRERVGLERQVFVLATRRLTLERLLAREERLARAARTGPTSELLRARARVTAARERLAAS
ncbi:MAG: hypothetical protein WKF41_09135 [Gaiellaceae bacterium]